VQSGLVASAALQTLIDRRRHRRDVTDSCALLSAAPFLNAAASSALSASSSSSSPASAALDHSSDSASGKGSSRRSLNSKGDNSAPINATAVAPDASQSQSLSQSRLPQQQQQQQQQRSMMTWVRAHFDETGAPVATAVRLRVDGVGE
jgi:hypothetical protein